MARMKTTAMQNFRSHAHYHAQQKPDVSWSQTRMIKKVHDFWGYPTSPPSPFDCTTAIQCPPTTPTSRSPGGVHASTPHYPDFSTRTTFSPLRPVRRRSVSLRISSPQVLHAPNASRGG